MKINKLLVALFAGAMLASCSDDRSNEPVPTPEAHGKGYVSIAIGLPSEIGSRANDNFDDGLKEEYAVKSLGILFFEGREDDAKFVRAYNVSDYAFGDKEPATGSQITNSKRVTFPVELTETTGSLWAIAVVNFGSVMTITDNTDTKEKGILTFKKDGSVFAPGSSFSDFLKQTTQANLSTYSATDVTKYGFFMTNAPYATAPGTGDNAPSGFTHLLAFVDKEKIKESEIDAKNNPAATVYVERAVAKVVVKGTPTVSDKLPAVSKIEWVIDNTEKETYIVRNLGESDPTVSPAWLTFNTQITGATAGYRFVGNKPFEANSDMYRIYYGIDPQGDGIELTYDDINKEWILPEESNFNVLTDANITTTTFKALETPQYCYENTFSVANQNYYNTTRVILKVTFAGGDFYTRGVDRTTKYTFNDAAATLAHFVVEQSDVVAAWTEYFKNMEGSTTITLSDLAFDVRPSNGIYRAENDWIKVDYSVEAGRLKVKDITLYDGKLDADGNHKETKAVVAFLEGVNKETVISEVNDMATFNAYVGGVSYYHVRIKHFGDDLTPWNEPKNEATGDLITTTNTKDSYGDEPDASHNYLGRYGVLRNNWYELNVTDISKFGEPTVKDLTLDGTPDDKNEPEKSIACKINILSWAKRTQDVEF